MKILGISYGTLNGGNDTMVKEALMGAKEGQVVTVNAPAGEIRYSVDKIER